MDSPPDIPSGRSPRSSSLQGPRPTPLKVRKDSHKIRKPPVVPPPQQHPPQQQLPSHQPPRAPVIIYTVSPKVIHANPNEFMTLVQRLTGPDPAMLASSSATSGTIFQDQHDTMMSPAARFASIEKSKSPDGKKVAIHGGDDDMEMFQENGISSSGVDRITASFPGILSPNPDSLPSITSNFFSQPSAADPNNNNNNSNYNPLMGFFTDVSPSILHSSKNYIEGSSLLPSPSNNFISPHMISPTTQELFNSLFD